MDAVAEIQMFASCSYEWVLEGDITACFDEIDHTAMMDRVRRRVGDKRVLALVKAVLKAGTLSEDPAADPRPAPHKAGSCPRCWRTSHWRCSMSTSPGSGRPPARPESTVHAAFDMDSQSIGWSATPTTSSCGVGDT